MFDEIPKSTIKLPEGRFQTFHDISLSEERRVLLKSGVEIDRSDYFFSTQNLAEEHWFEF